MARADKTMLLGVQYRALKLERSGFNKEKRTVDVILSTEAPVSRFFGEEILDHSPSSVDMEFFRSGGAALLEHDTNQRVGIVEDASITADRSIKATIRFAKTPAGEQAMAEIDDTTLRWVSVGYRVNKFQVDEKTDEYRAIRWQPLECSFVAIPADPNAKVLRSSNDENEVTLMFKRSINHDLDLTGSGGGGGAGASPAAPNVQPAHEDFSRIVNEATEMLSIAAHFQREYPEVSEMVQKAIKDKTGLVKFQRAVMDLISTKQPNPAPATGDPGQRNGNNLLRASTGTRFINSPSYKNALKENTQEARRRIAVDFGGDYRFRVVDQDLYTREFNATTESISGTSGANIAVVPGVPGLLQQQPLYIADLFAQGTTQGDTIRYIQEDTYTNAATRVAEGGSKPAATLDVSIVNATVQKTAVYTKVTDEMLSDFEQMSAFVNQRLGYMVQALEDQQLLTGSGSSQIKGVLNFTGLQTVSGATAPIDALLKAIEYVRGANSAGFAQPDALVMNTKDWLNVRLTKDANGQYLLGGPGYAPYGVGGYSNVAMAWGLPVVSTTSLSQGTALAGAFRSAAQIFRRVGLRIDTTNNDQDDFIKNLITVRAEQRMALCVYQPNRFCSVTAIPLPS